MTQEQLIEEAKRLGLMFYQPTEVQDIALLKWWRHLDEVGELETLFTAHHRSLSKFYNFLQSPCILSFKTNDEGEIICAAWFVPVSDSYTSAFMGYWADEGFRKTREHARTVFVIYSIAFLNWKVVVGVTQESLLRIHRKTGYNIVGDIPHFLNDESRWIVYLTKESWENSPVFKIGEKSDGKF